MDQQAELAGALTRLNESLSETDDSLTSGFGQPERPLIILVSPPRSGSTLLHQMIISAFEIGYISNIMARFWQAPYLGACLHQSVADPEFTSSCESVYGHAPHPQEPHEWGWFWQHHLRLSGDEHYIADDAEIDWVRLGQKLASIQKTFSAPLIVDNVFAMNALPRLTEHFDHIYPLVLKRDPYFVCNSVINLRLNRFDDISRLKFHLPRNVEDLRSIEHPVEQIVLQVKSIFDEIDGLLEGFPDESVLTIHYEDLKSSPKSVMAAFGLFMEKQSHPLTPKAHFPTDPEPNRNQTKRIRAEFKPDLDKFFEKYFEIKAPD